MKSPLHTAFYTIEKTIKVYRRFAQKRITKLEQNITLDQVIALKVIIDNKDISQKELAHLLFKDAASISKIIQTLSKKKMIERQFHKKDRRRYSLIPTKTGIQTISNLFGLIKDNRNVALKGIEAHEIEIMQKTLNKIIDNCLNHNK